jgi:hypothetical protein
VNRFGGLSKQEKPMETGVQGVIDIAHNGIDRVIELEQARARDNIAFKELRAERDELEQHLRSVVDSLAFHILEHGDVGMDRARLTKARNFLNKIGV